MAPLKAKKRVGFTGPEDVEVWADSSPTPALTLSAPSPTLYPSPNTGKLDPVELQVMLSNIVNGEGEDEDHHGGRSRGGKSIRESSSCRYSPREPSCKTSRPSVHRLAKYNGGSSISALCKTHIDNGAQTQPEAVTHHRENRPHLHDTTNHPDCTDTMRNYQRTKQSEYFNHTRSSSGSSTGNNVQDPGPAHKARKLEKKCHCTSSGVAPKPNAKLYDSKYPDACSIADTYVARSTYSFEGVSRGILGHLWKLQTPGTPATPFESTPVSPGPASPRSSNVSPPAFRSGGALTPGSSRTSNTVANIARHFSKRSQNGAPITKHMADIMSRQRYLVLLCLAMMTYGAPTHRLEDYMQMSARVLTVDAQFLYLPGRMLISFDDKETQTAQVKLMRAKQGIDLGRLRDVHEIYKEVVHDKLSASDALPRLQEIIDRKPRYGILSRIAVYGLTSAFIGPLGFQARLIDMPIAFLIGSLVGILELVVAPLSDSFSHVFEVTTAILVTLLARAFGSIQGGNVFCFGALAQSGIVLILPGYMILSASLELQSRNILAGGVRMVYALIYTLFLSYGMMIGASLYGFMDKNAVDTAQCTNPLTTEWRFLFSALFTLCLCIIFQAKWKQMPFMIFLSMVGTTVSFFVSKRILSNNQFVTAAAAFAVGFFANASSRFGPIAEEYLGNFWERTVMSRLSPAARREKAHEEFTRADQRCGDIESVISAYELSKMPSAESPPEPTDTEDHKPGYGSAASTMLPAIILMVPGGLAANGSLLAGIQYANEITSKTGNTSQDGTARILLSIIQIAIGMSVGLFLGVLVWYPRGKRRSGVFSL